MARQSSTVIHDSWNVPEEGGREGELSPDPLHFSVKHSKIIDRIWRTNHFDVKWVRYCVALISTEVNMLTSSHQSVLYCNTPLFLRGRCWDTVIVLQAPSGCLCSSKAQHGLLMKESHFRRNMTIIYFCNIFFSATTQSSWPNVSVTTWLNQLLLHHNRHMQCPLFCWWSIGLFTSSCPFTNEEVTYRRYLIPLSLH